MAGASQVTVRALALAACALSLSCGFANGVCSSDDDCGDGARCDIAYGLCQQTCSDDAQCASGACNDGICGDVISVLDSGPHPDDDAGPDALSVQVSSSPQTVEAGDEVKLEWSASSSAVSCQASAQTVFDDEASVLPNAPTEGTGSAFVPVNQDTTFRVACQDAAGDIRFDDTAVDVEVSGTLSASTAELNAGQSVTLSWLTFGATSCALHDAISDDVILTVPSEDVPAGQHQLVPSSTRYLLRCDGVDLPPVDLSLSSLTSLTAQPTAIGPEPEQVTLSWAYVGPSSCTVRVNGGAAHVDEAAEPGHQVTLDGTATLLVTCAGHDAPLSESLTVPRLIESFRAVESGTESAPPLSYGQALTLTWQAAASASCALNGQPQTAEQQQVSALTTTTAYTLVCSDAGGKSASATLNVQVLPQKPVLTGEIVPVLDGSGGVTGGELILSAATSDNAVSCEVRPSVGEPSLLPAQSGATSARVFSGTPSAGSGVVVYRASCASDAAGTLALSSDETVSVHYGNVVSVGGEVTELDGASLLVGSVSLTSDTALTSVAALGSLRQVSGNVLLLGLTHLSFQTLNGLRLERVIGDVEVRNNSNLTNVAAVHISDDTQDQGLAWLEEVYGDLYLADNASLQNIRLPRLHSVGGSYKVEDNGALEKIAMPALTSVQGALKLDGNPSLIAGATTDDGFDVLTTVGDQLVVNQTSLQVLHSYFPLLTQHGAGTFTVTGNASLPCSSVEDLFCRFDTKPGFSVDNNSGGCNWTQAPTCN